MRLLIVGAGGQGQVVADALLFGLEERQNYKLVGYLDDAEELWGKEFLGIHVLGPINKWHDIPHDALILGIGNNKNRSRVFEELTSSGAKFQSVCHPKALIGHDVKIGLGSYIGAYVILAAGTIVGSNTIVHGNSVIGHHNTIRDHVHIAPGVITAGNVMIGDGVMIGINASIMPQKSVGEWAIVGSATLVNKDVPSYATVVGVPFKMLKKEK